VDSTGAHSFLEVAPDSITTWELSGFSVSSTAGLGLGRGDPTEIKVFKPLFVDLKLPYKVIRGEVLEVVASVFNYLPEAQDVRLGLTVPAGQKGITIPADGQMRDLAVEANGAASFKVNITFDELGTAKLQLEGRSLNGAADSVVKSLKVVPEGFKQQSTINIMLQPPATGSQKETVPVRVSFVLRDCCACQGQQARPTCMFL
jgi:uncharacterized protein YfaS (alpha-2-macroglobulin family)